MDRNFGYFTIQRNYNCTESYFVNLRFFSESLNSKNPDQAKEVLLDAGRNNVDKVLDVLEDVIKSEKTKFHEKLQKISPNVPIPEKPAEIRPHPDVSMIKNESVSTVVSGCVQLH